MKPRRPRRSKTPLVVFVVLFLGAGVYFFWRSPESPAANSNATNAVQTATNDSVNQSSPSNVNTAHATYRDEEFNFSLQYPDGWESSRNESGSGESRIVNYVFGKNDIGVSLIVLPEALEGIIRESFSVSKETTITINGNEAQQLTGASSKDGSAVTLLLFKSHGTLFVLNGQTDLVEQVGATFTFFTE